MLHSLRYIKNFITSDESLTLTKSVGNNPFNTGVMAVLANIILFFSFME